MYDTEGHAAHRQKMRNLSMVFLEMHQENRPLGKQRCRWVENTKVNLNNVRECELDLFGKGQRPAVGACEHADVCSCLDHLSNYLLFTMDYDP